MAYGFRLRFPALELLAALQGDALSRASRPLSEQEKEILRGVFGSSLDLEAIRLAESAVANSPTTLGNTIRLRRGAPLPPYVLVHEAMHVWQFQTQGTRYVSDSAFHQSVAMLRTGSRAGAYEVSLQPGYSIRDYAAEQQAMIVEWAFRFPEWAEQPQVQSLMEEVRQARPLPLEEIVEEAAYGNASAYFSEHGMERRGACPLFRIEL